LADFLSHQLQIQPRFGNRSRALVVDGHATARSLLASQLRGLGVGQVLYSATAHDARQHLQNLGVDVLLVEYQLSADTLGQALIDEWRRDGLLPLRTVVVMLSSQASYQVVAQVAESALDGFIIKPFTPRMLEDRLIAAFQRKEALREIYDAIESDAHAQALALCEASFRQRGSYWTSAARLGAELALRLDQLPLANAMYAAVLDDKAVPWAKLGLARVLQAGGEAGRAVSTIQNLLADEPTYADAYDVMGRIHVEQGNLAGAIAAYRQAVEITPHSVARAQKYGILAWYAAEPDVALAALEHAARIGGDSPQFDHQALLLLAMARFKKGDAAGLQQCHSQLAGVLARLPKPAPQAGEEGADPRGDRLRRMAQMAQALVAVQARDRPQLQTCLVPAAEDLLAPGFDVEAASNLLSLIATSDAAGLTPQQADDWVRRAGLRFCVSKQVTEMLAKACDPAPTECRRRRPTGPEPVAARVAGGDVAVVQVVAQLPDELAAAEVHVGSSVTSNWWPSAFRPDQRRRHRVLQVDLQAGGHLPARRVAGGLRLLAVHQHAHQVCRWPCGCMLPPITPKLICGWPSFVRKPGMMVWNGRLPGATTLGWPGPA
jgi:DNA-binding response OmpR family regulator